MRRTPSALSSRERETPHLLRGKRSDAAIGKTALIRDLVLGGRDFPKDYVMNTCGAELTVIEVPIPDRT